MPKVTEAHSEARRLQILQAACVCVAENGFQQSTIQDICRTAGLSPGAVYGYFSGKDEILRALAEESLQRNAAVFEDLRKQPDLRAALTRLFDMFAGKCEPPAPELPQPVDANRIKVGMWAEAIRHPELRSVLQDSYRLAVGQLAGMIREARKRGQVYKGLDPTAAAQVLVSLLEGLALQRAIDPELDAGRYLKTLHAVLDAGFGSRKR